MKTISIVIPIYKVEQYIKRCMLSVFNQTYPAELIECVIVNDCTPDNSMNIVNKLITSYKGKIKFKIANHDKNQGLSVTRNTAIDIATGYYLLFIDSDDYITPDYIATLIEGIEQYNTDMAVGNSYNHASNRYHHQTDKVLIINSQEDIEKDVLNMTSEGFGWNRIIRRELIINNKIYFEPGIIYEDLLWNLLLSKHIKSVAFLPESTYSYEQNEGSILDNAKKDKNPAAKAFFTILKRSMEMTNNQCAIEYHLFNVHFALETLNCIHNHKITSLSKTDFYPLRNQLMKKALKISLLLFIYDLIMYKPFWYISQTKFYKNRRVNIRFRLRDILSKKTRWRN